MKFLNTHVYSMEVQFEDIDAGFVVHHPNYLKYLERARYKALMDIGFGFEEQIKNKKTFVIAEMLLNYKKPLSMGQTIYVLTRTIAVKKSSLKVLQVITSNKPSQERLAEIGDELSLVEGNAFEAIIRFVYIDLDSKKAIPIPLDSMTCLEVPKENYFEQNPERRNVWLKRD